MFLHCVFVERALKIKTLNYFLSEKDSPGLKLGQSQGFPDQGALDASQPHQGPCHGPAQAASHRPILVPVSLLPWTPISLSHSALLSANPHFSSFSAAMPPAGAFEGPR